MSNIVRELRTSKRQLFEKFDASQRQVTDNNNNNNNSVSHNYYSGLSSSSSSQIHNSSTGRVPWNRFHPALTPTSAAQLRRTGQSKRRRSRAELSYDEYGALNLTTKKTGRTSNTAPRRTSVLLSAATMSVVAANQSAPLDLRVHSSLPYVTLLFTESRRRAFVE